MGDYTVFVRTDGASKRDVEKWQDDWADSAVGTWGKVEPVRGSDGHFTMSLEIKDKKLAEKAIEATKKHDKKLVSFGVT